jgi:PRTRC genetic system protein A
MRVLVPHISCVVNLPLSAEETNEFDLAVQEGYAEIYAVTAEGVIKHHKLRGQNRYVRVKVDRIPGFEPARLPQAISFLPAGRIPRAVFDQILAFFYKVMEVNGDRALEAMAWICYNPEQGYHVIVPPQTVGGASVSYDWSCVPPGTSIVVDIHSHNNMNAFFSGTDDRDDAGNISFSGVVGHMLAETGPKTVWRFNYQQRKFEASFDQIFEASPVGETPAEWLSQVKIYSAPAGRGSWTGGSGKGKNADHLKDFQFKKGNKQQGSSGDGRVHVGGGSTMREGPHLRGRLPLSFEGDFWGMSGMDDLYDNLGGAGRINSEADRALALALSDNSQEEAGSGKSWAGLANERMGNESSLNVDARPADLLDDGVPGENQLWNGHERFDELMINHGAAVAESYCVIDDFMSSLSGKDALLEELIADMFELSSEEGQADIFKTLVGRLPSRVKEAIQTNGL